MDDVDRPVNGESPSVKAARMIALISRVDINTRLSLCFVLIIALMSVGTGILLRQTQTVFRGIEPNNTLDPTVLPTLETIQGLLPSQIDSLTTLASVADWDALSQRMEQPVETLENLSAELVDTASRDLQKKRSEAARQIERAQIRTLFILTGVGGLTIVIAALLGFGITQTITRPLRSLVDRASALASGEFSHHGRLQTLLHMKTWTPSMVSKTQPKQGC